MGFNWKKVGQAQVFGRGKYLKDGEYDLVVDKMYTIETRKSGPALIVDFTVKSSTNDEIAEESKRNWFQSLQDKDIAYPAVKEFMLNLFQIDQTKPKMLQAFEDELDEIMEECSDEKWEKADAKKHPLHGKTIHVECYTKKTKEKGNDFTVHNWSIWEG